MATIDTPPAQSLAAFVDDTRERGDAEAFACVSARLLGIDVDGGVWLSPGAAVAYRGHLSFERLPTIGAGSAREAFLREAAPLVRASGKGRLYCAAHSAHVRVVRLSGESVVVSWRNLLAIEESVRIESFLAGNGVCVAAGGQVVARLSGHGHFAIATHGSPLTLEVAPDRPLTTDPHATVAWSASLAPTLRTALSWRTAVGHGGREPFQMAFAGTGVVVVQPAEDPARFAPPSSLLKRLVKLLRP